jgi:predicted MFS family arabinose efflux permease
VLFLGMGIGMGLGPIIAGWIEELSQLNSVFYFAGAVVLAGTAVFAWFTRQYRGPVVPAGGLDYVDIE